MGPFIHLPASRFSAIVPRIPVVESSPEASSIPIFKASKNQKNGTFVCPARRGRNPCRNLLGT